jgi:hypothetical protein
MIRRVDAVRVILITALLSRDAVAKPTPLSDAIVGIKFVSLVYSLASYQSLFDFDNALYPHTLFHHTIARTRSARYWRPRPM